MKLILKVTSISIAPQVSFQILSQFMIRTFIARLAIGRDSAPNLAPPYSRDLQLD